MKDIKYQIFISSTYEDLKEERRLIVENILTMGHFPIGMESFLASNEEQFKYIKKIIDNCDYYVLIIGARYGSIHQEAGLSFTEMEYDYAVLKNKPILIFPMNDLSKMPSDKKDTDLQNVLKFKNKVSKNKLVKEWKNSTDLQSSIILSLSEVFEENPQQGWIRPGKIDNTELLNENHKLQKENIELKNKIVLYEKQFITDVLDLAEMNENFPIHYSYSIGQQINKRSYLSYTWNDIFAYVGPKLYTSIDMHIFQSLLHSMIEDDIDQNYYNVSISSKDIDTIKIQFEAYKYIDIFSAKLTEGRLATFIQITQKGLQYLKQIKTVKTIQKEQK